MALVDNCTGVLQRLFCVLAHHSYLRKLYIVSVDSGSTTRILSVMCHQDISNKSESTAEVRSASCTPDQRLCASHQLSNQIYGAGLTIIGT